MSGDKETKQFEAEVSQLLQLMINNLYSKKEVFLRELISNASDALDRLRFAAVKDDSLYGDDSELEIRISYDEEAGTLTIADNGIGMSREEVERDIGTIAQSGAQQFMEQLQSQGDVEADDQLIGQFGVGFYSAFIVADRVELTTRRAGLEVDEAVRWESEGEGEYTVEPIEKQTRGTQIVLYLREGEEDLLDGQRLREIVETYSDHVSFPIQMPVEDDEETGWETVNQASALWTRRPNAISDEEYEEFYKHVAHEFNEPLTWTHSHVEGRMKFSMLFYLPERRPFDMAQAGAQQDASGVKLYVRRVFIMDDAEMFLPSYMGFVRGVIDSDDLSLNVSRETLQENRVVNAMKQTATKRVLDMIEDLDEEDYQSFWGEFGDFIKRGVVEDRNRQDRLAGLLRFASTHHDREEQTVSLDEYVERMGDDQDSIYYVTAESFEGAKNSPHLEVFRDNDVEVLMLYDRIDEWVVEHLEAYDGHELESVAIGELDDAITGDEDESTEEAEREYGDLVQALQTHLGDRAEDVRVTHRLTDSPTCLVAQEGGMSKNFERILREAGQRVPNQKPILEINPDHPIIERLNDELDNDRIGDWAHILFDQAWLSEGGRLENPAGFVQRMNDLMIELLGESGSDIITPGSPS
jgi:molecular chaperone HtpG